MTNAEEMAMKTVHDLGVAGDWDVERDGYTIYCPYCGYRMKLCSICDVRDGGKYDWNSETGGCKNDKI